MEKPDKPCKYCGHPKVMHDGAKNLGSCHCYSNGNWCLCNRYRTSGETSAEMFARLSKVKVGETNEDAR